MRYIIVVIKIINEIAMIFFDSYTNEYYFNK